MLIESFWNQVQLIWGGKLHTKQNLELNSSFIGLSHPSILRRVRKKVTAGQRCIAKRGLCRVEKDVICLRR